MTTRYSHVSEVPLSLAVWLATDTYDYNPDPFTISATTLLKPLRQIILPARLEPTDALVSLPDMVKSRIGSAIHDAIERSWLNNHRNALAAMGFPKHIQERVLVNPSAIELASRPDAIPVYLEQRLTRKLGKWTVTGKFDFVGEGRVTDFKSTTVWTYLQQVNNTKYTEQGSIYRWLDPKLITADEMDLVFIFTDWKASQANQASDPSYPSRGFKRQVFQLNSLADTERFIRRKLDLIETYWDAPEASIPQCTDDELWRSEPTWKYYRNPLKTTRSTRNFTSKHDAYTRLAEDGGTGIVKEVPGQATACKYCAAFPLCGQKDLLIEAGDLQMSQGH